MSEPTAGVLRVARGIADVLVEECDDYEEYVRRVAALINRETGLPELLEAALAVIDWAPGEREPAEVEAWASLRTAIAKATQITD